MTANTNIVDFPGYYFPGNEPEDPLTLEQVQDRVDAIRDVFIEAASEAVVAMAMQAIGAAGFEQDPDDEDQVRDTAMVQAAIKSLMMRTRGMSHPLQTVAEQLFDVSQDEDGYYYVEAKT